MDDYDCPYHDKSLTEEFLKNEGIEPCGIKCPLNTNKTCYRWDICFPARKWGKDE